MKPPEDLIAYSIACAVVGACLILVFQFSVVGIRVWIHRRREAIRRRKLALQCRTILHRI